MSQRLSRPFWRPALVQQALPAIIFAVLRRFRGPALFRGPRPSSRQGASFRPSGLTLRSSRPAYGGRLTLAVRRRQCHQSAAPPKFKAQSEGPFNERLCRSTQLGLEAGSGEREEEATGLPALQQSSSVLLGLRRRRLGISRNLDLQAQTALRL